MTFHSCKWSGEKPAYRRGEERGSGAARNEWCQRRAHRHAPTPPPARTCAHIGARPGVGDVGVVLQQQPHRAPMTIHSCIVQRCAADNVPRPGVGVVLQQQPHRAL
eukprot:CAMPEP_0205870136 /NCGR_PEP_ID=MMETSP1083-20121108/10406_1 /ASSEMBLY_ACC=CAM_ASM_000430 /TAXON_ID=97485 /ORGANISM="Prymnesium parvum, Strain Texoma1" /LENGTH=105 /DNA_ID=CAMNT_0053232415 /DNA_START=18 /DNA_END=333 /DNA_ORIENTATION=+